MKTGLTKKQKVTELFYNAKDPITTLGSFLQHYSMIYKTKKRHDRNHAVS